MSDDTFPREVCNAPTDYSATVYRYVLDAHTREILDDRTSRLCPACADAETPYLPGDHDKLERRVIEGMGRFHGRAVAGKLIQADEHRILIHIRCLPAE